MANIKIGPAFFRKELREYSSWQAAYVREALQNCIDAKGSKSIDITVSTVGQNTRITFANDGVAMDKSDLTDKLLALGESGKNFQGSVGGFGKAKLLLYMAQESYTIKSGGYLVRGIGGEYELSEEPGFLSGTRSEVIIPGNECDRLIQIINRFASFSQWNGNLTVNGKKLETKLWKGTRRKDFTWATIYTQKTASGILVVRINGIMMFSKPIAYKDMVLLELTGKSVDTLTSNRDGLLYQQQMELDAFISEIAINKRSALKEAKATERKSYAGYSLTGSLTASVLEPKTDKEASNAALATMAHAIVAARGDETDEVVQAEAEKVINLFQPEFHIKNETGLKIPEWFKPDTFSDYSKRLVSNWISLLVELAVLTGLKKKFAVGFCFNEAGETGDGESEGEYEVVNGQNVVFVNPATITNQRGKPRQIKTKWKFSANGNWELLALAIHEFVHLEFGHGTTHDEEFAGRQTDLTALVLQNRTLFGRHFSAPVIWPE